jgi:hypothetical protein
MTHEAPEYQLNGYTYHPSLSPEEHPFLRSNVEHGVIIAIAGPDEFTVYEVYRDAKQRPMMIDYGTLPTLSRAAFLAQLVIDGRAQSMTMRPNND